MLIASIAFLALLSRIWDDTKDAAHHLTYPDVVYESHTTRGWPIPLTRTSRDIALQITDSSAEIDILPGSNPFEYIPADTTKSINACAPWVEANLGPERATHFRAQTPWKHEYLWWNWLLYPLALLMAWKLPIAEAQKR